MDPVSLALTGQLPFVVLAAAAAAFPVSLLLLSLYRRKVVRTMGTSVGAEPVQPLAPKLRTTAPGRPALALSELDASKLSGEYADALYGRLKISPWQGACVYALGGVVFTLVMTLSVLISSSMELLPVRFALVFWVYGWPIVIAVNLVGASTQRDRLLAITAYLAILIMLSAIALAGSTALTFAQIAALWAITNLPPTLLLLAFLARPIRAVGPLVLTFMLLAFTGSVLALALAGSNDALLRAIAAFAFGLGASATETFIAIIVLGFAVFGVLGWLAVGWLRRAYVSKRVSDQSISLDAMWLLFGIVQSVGLAFEGVFWMLSGLTAFSAYKLTVWAAFRWQGSRAGKVANSRLLLLRVFALGKRSERLFEQVSKHWRYRGSVQLIAGPDLAMTTVEPHEFLDFVTGGIANSFISEQAALDRRMQALDIAQDHDQRFRVNDFFCYADTWELVLSRLVRDSDAIMMDLRSFSPQNAGCVRELQELVNFAPLRRVVLVIDDTTDAPFLRETLALAWQNVDPQSPNLADGQAEVRLLRLNEKGGRNIQGLLACLVSCLSVDAAACR